MLEYHLIRYVTTTHCTYNIMASVTDGFSHKYDDVIKWKRFPRYCPFVRGIHRSPVNSPHKGQWRRALMFSLICTWINGWVNNGESGDLRRHRAHHDVIVMRSIRQKVCPCHDIIRKWSVVILYNLYDFNTTLKIEELYTSLNFEQDFIFKGLWAFRNVIEIE